MSVATPREARASHMKSPLPIAEAYMTTPPVRLTQQMSSSNVRSWLGSIRPATSSSTARMLPSANGERGNEQSREEKSARVPLFQQDTSYIRRGSSLLIQNEQAVRTKRIRLGALIPFFMSGVSFVLTLLLVISGTSPGYYENLNLISFNTTNLGTGIISFVPATATATTTTNVARIRALPTGMPTVFPSSNIPTTPLVTAASAFITPAPSLDERQLSIPSPGDLLSSMSAEASKIGAGINSATSQLGSGINSEASKVGSGLSSVIASMTISGISLPTGTSGSGSSIGSGITSGLESLLTGGLSSIFTSIFGGIISGITSNIDSTMNALVMELIEELKDKVGVQDYYSLHVLHACSGWSSTNMTGCPSYGDAASSLAKAGTSIPTNFVVLGTNITSPILTHLKHVAEVAGPKAEGLQKALLALLTLSLIGSGLSIFFSFFAIFLPNNRFLIYANLSLITFGVISRVIDAAASTLINILVGQLVNYVGNTVGLYAETGTYYLVFTWIAFVTATIASAYWFSIWFVEFRQVSYRQRDRTAQQIGNYRLKSVARELRDDIKGTKRAESDGSGA